MAPANIRPSRRQHTVTKSVLKRFTDHDGRLTVFDGQRGMCSARTPGSGIFTVLFDSHDPRGAEERWNRVESKFPRLFRHLDSRTALDDPPSVETMREFLAMHWARSIGIMVARASVAQSVIEQSKRSLVERRPQLLAKALRDEVGIIADSRSALEWMSSTAHDRVAQAHQHVWDSERNRENYEQALAIIAKSEIQIGYAPPGRDLVIGDCPVVTTRADRPGVGPHQGVALGDAEGIAMPMGPGVLVGLGPELGQMDMHPTHVEWYNARQWDGFQQWIAAKPGGSGELRLRSAQALRELG
jgi:hypothetical protein